MRNMYRVFQGIFQGNLTLLPLLAIGLTGIITNTGCSGNVTGGTSYDEDASVDTQGPSSASVLAEAGPDALAANVTNISTVTLNLYAEGATYYQASSDRAELKFDNAALPPLAMAGDVDTGTYCLEGETADTCNALPADTDDTYTIWVRYYDDVGNGSEIVSVTLRADNITPVLSGLTVALGDTVRSEEGKLYTRFEVLTVEPTVTMDTGLQMQLSTDDTFDSESWVGHAPTASVILPSGDCEVVDCKSVSVRYRDDAGNMSSTQSVLLTLDTTPPRAPRVVDASALVTDVVYDFDILSGTVSDTFFLRFEISGGQYDTFADSVTDMTGLPASMTTFPVLLEDNRVNTLRIRAVDKAGNRSDDAFAMVEHDDHLPSPPSALKLAAYDGRLALSWIPSGSADVDYYLVRYGTITGVYSGTEASLGTSPINVGTSTGMSLSGLANGNRYYVVLTAIDRAGNESEFTPEISAVPSEFSPVLIGQVGGPTLNVWGDGISKKIYLPREGGLVVFDEDGVEIAYLDSFPDTTQVLFDGDLVYIHSAVRTEVVPPNPNAWGLPNSMAPDRVLTILDQTDDYSEVASVALPANTAFFCLVKNGTERRALSSTLGAYLAADSDQITMTGSELSIWDIDTDGIPFESATVDPGSTAGWSLIDERYVFTAGYASGTYKDDNLLAMSADFAVWDAFAVGDPQIASGVTNLADDGVVIMLGKIPTAYDVLVHAIGEMDAIPLTDLSVPAVPAVHGDPWFIADPYSTVVLNGTTTAMTIDGPDLGFLESLTAPMLEGHTVTFSTSNANNGLVRTIDSYSFDNDAGTASYVLDSALPVALGFGDGVSFQIDSTPALKSVTFEDGSRLSRGDPVSRAVFNLASDRVTIHEYAITVSASGESASKTASRTMPEKIQTYRITSAHVIVVTVANIYIFPRATWSAATALAVIPLDYYAHQLLVRNGYVYFGARQGNRISVLDAGNPRAPKQVGSFSLTRPLIRMASDGNRIYVLQGECSEANGKRNSGCDAIPDLLTYTTTRHDKYVATSFTTATAASPTLVATKALSHTHIDDLVPVNNQIYLYSHGDAYGAGSDAHFIRVRGQSHDELPGTFIAETAFDEPQRQQGDLAVSGQYVFIWTDRHLEAYRTDSATVATNVGQSLTCGAGLCVDAIYDMQVVGDYLYIFDYFHSFMVFDISGVLDGSNDGGYSGTENILQVGGWGGVTSYGGLVSGAYAYVISSTGLILLDISDPTAPVEVTTIDVSAIDLAVEGGVLYVSTEDAGLQIYELSRPSAFRTGIRYQEASGVVGQFDIGREHLFATQGDQIISWKIATTSSEVDPFVMLTSGLDMPYNGTLRVFDDKLWVSGQSGWNGACGGSETCLQIYDASYINETAMASRLRELNNPATKTNPFNTDGADCSSDVDCCGWQYCSWDSDLSKNVCKTGSVPIIRKVVKGPGTEYFALVRGSDGGQDRMGQPNDGIYTFSWDDQYSDPVRRTTTTDDGILAGHDGACNLTNPDATGIYDILWKDGVLYIAGSYLSATRATRWSDDEFLQWTGDTWSVNKTRGDGDNLCAHQLAASGSLLYVLGDTSDSTSCIEDWRLTRTGSTVSYTSRTLWVFDISDPMNPVQISQTDLPHQVDSMAVSGNWGYFPEERSGETIIMDIFDPTAPVPYGAYQTTGINSSVMVYGPDVFVNGENTGIRSIDGR